MKTKSAVSSNQIDFVFFGNMIDGVIGDYGAKKYKEKNLTFIYKGQFKDERFNGVGILTNLDKNITYSGNFIDGFLEGEGIIDGPEYEYVGEIK